MLVALKIVFPYLLQEAETSLKGKFCAEGSE